MNLHLAFATSWEECGLGYCTEFADLGMTALVIGPIHMQFSCDDDCIETRESALSSPWKALRAVAQRRTATSAILS